MKKKKKGRETLETQQPALRAEGKAAAEHAGVEGSEDPAKCGPTVHDVAAHVSESTESRLATRESRLGDQQNA